MHRAMTSGATTDLRLRAGRRFREPPTPPFQSMNMSNTGKGCEGPGRSGHSRVFLAVSPAGR